MRSPDQGWIRLHIHRKARLTREPGFSACELLALLAAVVAATLAARLTAVAIAAGAAVGRTGSLGHWYKNGDSKDECDRK
jgi:hypothetical protein